MICSFNLSPELVARLEALARKEDRSRSAILRRLIFEATEPRRTAARKGKPARDSARAQATGVATKTPDRANGRALAGV